MVKPNDILYYARILNDSADCYELKVRYVNEECSYFTALDGGKNGSGVTFLFNFNDIGKSVFLDREQCMNVLRGVEL